MDKDLKLKLKKLAHSLKPVVMIGQKGLTASVLNETDVALKAHECIKIKITGWEKEDKTEMVNSLCQHLHSDFVDSIGNIFILYRERND
jgi:RNA-binding protein